MILGYNQARPKKQDYEEFEKKLVSGISGLNIDGLSLMLYGSYVRGDSDFGRSDIDAVLIFPDKYVINKENLHKASVVVHEALKGKNVPFQVTVTDIETMRDGRFNSYDDTFEPYFKEEARITGKDYRPEIKYELPTMNEQSAVRFNLRKIRTGLLFAEHDKNEDYDAFLSKFNKSLDAVSRGSKQIVYFVDGVMRKNRFSGIDAVRETFPNVYVDTLLKIKRLYKNHEQLDAIYKKPDKALELWNSAATFFEEMIKAYIEICPRKEK
jgi:hypothetical protein